MDEEDWSVLAKAQKLMWIFVVVIAVMVGFALGAGYLNASTVIMSVGGLSALCATLYFLGKPLKRKGQ